MLWGYKYIVTAVGAVQIFNSAQRPATVRLVPCLKAILYGEKTFFLLHDSIKNTVFGKQDFASPKWNMCEKMQFCVFLDNIICKKIVYAGDFFMCTDI